MHVRTLTVTFDLPLRYQEIDKWRGAFVELTGGDLPIFHNHKDNLPNRYIKEYSRIQYRSTGRRAAIFAINEGIDALQDILERPDLQIYWYDQPTDIRIHSLNMEGHYLQMTATPQHYRLRRWLPFNQHNYPEWRQAKNLRQRIRLLEKILTGHILGACQGCNYHIPERLRVELQRINRTTNITYKDVGMVALDIEYTTNILLPQGIGIGKSTALGFGCQNNIRPRYPQALPENDIQVTSYWRVVELTSCWVDELLSWWITKKMTNMLVRYIHIL